MTHITKNKSLASFICTQLQCPDLSIWLSSKHKSAVPAHRESQHLVILGVRGLSFLRTGGITFSIKGNSAQLKNDVSLSLQTKNLLAAYQHGMGNI